MIANPAAAYAKYVEMKPHLNSDINRKIFQRSFRYFSRDLKNVDRDWNKVTNYCKRLNIVDGNFEQNQTNEFLSWPLLAEGPGGVEPPTVETGVVDGGCKRCHHPSISEPEIFAQVSDSNKTKYTILTFFISLFSSLSCTQLFFYTFLYYLIFLSIWNRSTLGVL